MSKIALLFPGQGSQVVGMGKDFYEQIPCAKKIYEEASEWLGLDMKHLCFEENDLLNKTEYTQIALVTTCLAIYAALMEKGLNYDYTAGLSLGEYAALVASKVISVKEAITVVRKRGIFMEHEVPAGIGAMAAVLGLEEETIEGVCERVSQELGMVVQMANYNCPGQVVISGRAEAVERAKEELEVAGAKRVLMLNVSGPFHSLLLTGAGEKLKEELDGISVQKPVQPYICNVTSEMITEQTNIKELLVKQVYSPVRFRQSIELLIKNGVDTFIEIGPGKTLSGFVKKIDKTKRCIQIGSVEDLIKIEEVIHQ